MGRKGKFNDNKKHSDDSESYVDIERLYLMSVAARITPVPARIYVARPKNNNSIH